MSEMDGIKGTAKETIETLTRRNQMEGDTGGMEEKRKALRNESGLWKDGYFINFAQEYCEWLETALIEEREAHAGDLESKRYCEIRDSGVRDYEGAILYYGCESGLRYKTKFCRDCGREIKLKEGE